MVRVHGVDNAIMKIDDRNVNRNGLVSIIIPNYNGGNTLKETVESVIAQTYNNWELIIIDDSSTDSSQLIIDELHGSLIQPDNSRVLNIPIISNIKRLFSTKGKEQNNNLILTGSIDLEEFFNPNFALHVIGKDISLTSS